MNCELLDECPFFNGLSSVAVNALKEVYCHGNPMICARRQLANAVGRNRVPVDLKPNHNHLVRDLIETILAEG